MKITRKQKRQMRNQMRRIKSLRHKHECPGCGLKGPWLGIFVHPIMPIEVRGECEFADSLEPMRKMSRLMTLNMMGVPLDERIMKGIEKEMFDNPTPESTEFIHFIHGMLKQAGVLEQIDKPSDTTKDSRPEFDENAWKQFD